ncbi:arylalkylamine N-acetyltransferase-like 2 [Toxorhynchites rutilus septentrionalis]|uniref:arylalkylamine N-acetyltransferase-like 2 n=1 Tax=Toxorhynchites rutilus septentrionalis TaxID=329112 RepID=UPI002478441E|nr:arylalkylamine N-acetyltransferase-like 2 [Toxorhynchites rutilus septentrionalis]XP_055620553.1 arylalkylamine N-acetyltransferase-like 2 [Toxorhynchites rutilus septentrionalis]
MINSDSINLRVARPDEVELVREVLRTIYYPEEAITISYMHGSEPTLDDERFSLSFVQQGTVVLAEDSNTSKPMGISIAGPIEPGDPDLMVQEAAITETKKWSDILKLLALLERTADVCGRYGLPRAYHVHILAVDPACRGHALGFRLMQFQIDLARKLGFGAISGDFTSVYSAKIADKLEMECINELSLGDYRDEKSDKLFDPQEAHRVIKTYAKVLK